MGTLEALGSSPVVTCGDRRPLVGDPWGEGSLCGVATDAAGDDRVMGLKPRDDEVERPGDPIPDNEWKDGVEEECARPVPLTPGTNSAIFPTEVTLTFREPTPSKLRAATLFVSGEFCCC